MSAAPCGQFPELESRVALGPAFRRAHTVVVVGDGEPCDDANMAMTRDWVSLVLVAGCAGCVAEVEGDPLSDPETTGETSLAVGGGEPVRGYPFDSVGRLFIPKPRGR